MEQIVELVFKTIHALLIKIFYKSDKSIDEIFEEDKTILKKYYGGFILIVIILLLFIAVKEPF